MNRITPGDGVNFVFPLLLGINRARYFLLTGQQLDAARAHELGLVAEIHERERSFSRGRGSWPPRWLARIRSCCATPGCCSCIASAVRRTM